MDSRFEQTLKNILSATEIVEHWIFLVKFSLISIPHSNPFPC